MASKKTVLITGATSGIGYELAKIFAKEGFDLVLGFQRRAGAKRSQVFGKLFMMDDGSVARVGYKGLMRGDIVVIPGMRNKLMVLTSKLVPDDLKVGFIKFLQRRTRLET